MKKKQPQKGRDLYDIVGDVDFNSRLWNELGEKLNRDARNVEIRAFRIWNLAQTNGTGVLRQLTDEEYQDLEVYLDELKRGVNPEWGKLSLKFKIPSRLICNRLLCRKIYTWNSTADTVLKNLVDQVLEEATIQISTTPTISLSHSASGASKVVPPTLLETACFSSTSLPLPPPKPHPPYTTLNLNGISALKLFQTSESNLNKRIDYAFIRSGFHLKAKPSTETPQKTYPSSTSPLDTIQLGDDAISLGGITAKRMTALTDFYTQFSHVIPWDVVSTRVNKHLEGLEFAGSAYNCLASERLKGVNGKWVVRRREDGKPSNAGIKGVAFSTARCQRRWVGLMREGIWNTSKW
ncbi:hypothetical protein BCR33DRAFT_29689 [Rhizoclosmatium globosum]|uniref:Uncharacterized protein n=1 Tax=Rhizoclosmatium globosum TaxID=329046 RepID=A0A1Y2AXW1_9FUNG|nr:hypothetical protein BCR33DRAFT_29689 [Rhizoclosmatium globosum]|eukprot:ORY27057.1 hypothetical protein BCR33DRAFT_29689 [Rhizoclosmatium globosum]